MFKSLIVLTMAALMLSNARAADQPPAMRDALRALVASQQLEKNWPLILERNAKNGAAMVERGSLDKLAEVQGLTEGQRAQIRQRIAAWSPAIAAEILELNRNTDVNRLMLDMTEAVYPKYFNAREVSELAAFYRSVAFKKVTAIGMKVDEEASRTGASKEDLWPKHAHGLSAEDQAALAAFSNSPVGKKQQELGSRLNADVMQFFQKNHGAQVAAIADRYALKLAADIKRISSN